MSTIYPKICVNYVDLNIKQYKTLISHSEYLISKELFLKEMSRTDIPDKKKNSKIGKEYLKKYGEYFTDKSPLFDAMQTGYLSCNGQHTKVKFEQL